ncbi:hypothetical protein TrLO_g10221 [Triparma laevis f. longispina]|uniref:PDZ domain-containing protein n=1 Tax=Triparma laevis f. longispina TaxID=1714387 RepID=A0A9W7CBJ4_9STRA|nr:hypothetical protein TrLO_g10221 [Triparma laevis f. longispina]
MDPGYIFLTTFGPAVILASPDPSATVAPTSQFRVAIWRHPGSSFASASTAYINPSELHKPLPVTPGMSVSLKAKASDTPPPTPLTVQQYFPSTDTYLLSPNTTVTTSELLQNYDVHPSNLFYPLLDKLLSRAQDLVTGATADPVIRTILEKAKDIDVEKIKESLPDIETLKEGVSGMLTPPKVKQISSSHANDVLNLLKQDDVKTLLEKSRDRLTTLVNNEIPEQKKKLLESTGITIEDSSSSSIMGVLNDKNRRAALDALDKLLDENQRSVISNITDTVDSALESAELKEAKDNLTKQFSDVMATLGDASTTDETLDGLVSTFNEKTTEFQELTGALLETKSVAMLFEGAERLKQRTNRVASQILNAEQLATLESSTSTLLAKLVDGDEAVLKLKALQLGDSVKSRLIHTLELHTASRGGLDGIIASAITDLNDKTASLDSDLQDLIESLQASASSTSKDTNEALLTLLSQKSNYREQILLKVEESLCTINSQLQDMFGESLNAATILSVANGTASTEALFEPIAIKARSEINLQLDVVEKEFGENSTALQIITYVRNMVAESAEANTEAMTLKSTFDNIASTLNDDSSVAVGQQLLMKSERVLDVLEDASKNKTITSLIESARNAGYTEDKVVQSIANLDVDGLLNDVDGLVNDDQARRNMVAKATDSALEFLLTVLPSVEIPKLEGVKDGNMFSIENLSMEAFKLRKEDIDVQIAGISTNAYAAANNTNADKSESEAGVEVDGENYIEPAVMDEGVPATELLVIKVDNIQASLEGIKWSFGQTYFPHMKGAGEADAKIENAHLLLKFELRKKLCKEAPSSDFDGPKYEPVLCLHDRQCTMESMSLQVKGDGLSWLYNMLTSLFKGLLKEYVIKTVLEAITNSSGYLLEALNEQLAPYWPLIMRMGKLNIEELLIIDENAISDTTQILGKDIIELVWREPVPLGMKLLMNDGSGEVKVVEFPRGGQALRVAEAAELDPDFFRGAAICGVNGTKFLDPAKPVGPQGGPIDTTKIQQVLAALKEPGRPKSIEFLISESERKRIMRVLGKFKAHEEVEDEDMVRVCKKEVNRVEIVASGTIGLTFGVVEDELGLKVLGFKEGKENDKIKVGSILVSVNGEWVYGGEDGGVEKSTNLFKKFSQKRPLELGFVDPATIVKVFENTLPCATTLKDVNTSMIGCPSIELILSDARQKETDEYSVVVLTGFEGAPGALEAGGVRQGDVLMSVNGTPFFISSDQPESSQRKALWSLVNSKNEYPITFEFARPKTRGDGATTPPRAGGSGGNLNFFSSENSERYTVEVFEIRELGVKFKKTEFNGPPLKPGSTNPNIFKRLSSADDSSVKLSVEYLQIAKLEGVKGPVRRSLLGVNRDVSSSDRVGLGMSISRINGHSVPAAASAEDVVFAFKRAWADQGRKIEIVFKDVGQENFIKDLERGE